MIEHAYRASFQRSTGRMIEWQQFYFDPDIQRVALAAELFVEAHLIPDKVLAERMAKLDKQLSAALIANAQNAGFDITDIDVRDITAREAMEHADNRKRLPQQRATIPKSIIIERLHAAGKLAAAKAALDSNLLLRERWYAPDRPAVNADDPDTIALLQAIGADPKVILAPLPVPVQNNPI